MPRSATITNTAIIVATMAVVAAVGSPPAVAAEPFTQVRPAPGLWEAQTRVIVNGQDVTPLLAQFRDQYIAQLPPAQQAATRAEMELRGVVLGAAGKDRSCLRRDDVDAVKRPEDVLRMLENGQPGCTYRLIDASGPTMRFQGRCERAQGSSYVGTIDGELTLSSAKAWQAKASGNGQLDLPSDAAQGLLGLAMANGLLQTQFDMKAQWLQADCGKVKPQ